MAGYLGNAVPGVYDEASGSSENALDAYMREVSKTPLLTREEEVELGRKSLAGDLVAREHLVRANLRFAFGEAMKWRSCGLPISELVAEANLGLMKAAAKYDPDKGEGWRFISYAVNWCHQSMRRAIYEQRGVVRVPANRFTDSGRVSKARDEFKTLNGRAPTPSELAGETGLSEDVVSALLIYCAPVVRLDAPIREGDDRSPAELIAYTGSDAQRMTEECEVRDLVIEALGSVNERQARILRLYYGIDCDEHTLEEISRVIGVTRERVRQLRDKALAKIRESRHAKRLAACYEE